MTGESAAEFVSGVNLNAGLIGMDLQHPAAEPVKDFDRRAITAKDKAMIVAQAIEYLRVRLQNPSAQAGCLTEVELGAFDGSNFTGRNLLGIGRQERLGGDGDLVVQHVAWKRDRQD